MYEIGGAREQDTAAATCRFDSEGDCEVRLPRADERRLEAVRNYLAERGVTLAMLVAEACGEGELATRGYCHDMGPETRANEALVECLQPDRRVEVEIAGRNEKK